jgi:hypothetical protein
MNGRQGILATKLLTGGTRKTSMVERQSSKQARVLLCQPFPWLL